MKILRFRLLQLPIRWKLTVWSSLLLCLLFIAYNTAQYFVINHWLMKQEEISLQKKMDELQIYLQEKKSTLDENQIKESKSFIEKLNQHNQMIRILDNKGKPILSITDDLPDPWVAPRFTTQPELLSEWHITDHLLIMRSPLITPEFTGTIEIVNNLENLDKINELVFIVMFIGGIVAIVLSGVGGALLSRQLLKPIQSISEAMRKIKQKGFHERVIMIENQDEISNLAMMFNEMMDQVESAYQQQKQFIEDASHELRTPISILDGHISLLHRWGKNDPAILEESLNASMQEVSRLKALVQELLELSRAESIMRDTNLESVNPNRILHPIIKNISMLHPEFTFDMNLEKLVNVGIEIVPHHLEQIFLILLDNAMKYTLEDRCIHIFGFIQNGFAHIQIIDQGIGIPTADLPFVFDRFYRVDKSRSRKQGGHGLGLAIAKRLVERYSGMITISSDQEQGTSVKISFPLQL